MSLFKEVKSELKRLDLSKPTLRKFGFTMAAVLAIIGVFVFFKGSVPERAYILWAVAAAFLLSGGLIPSLLKPVNKLWMGLALVMGWFMSRIILSLVFILAITPVSLVMKLLSKDLLEEKIDRDVGSYWIRREKVDIQPERYFKLY